MPQDPPPRDRHYEDAEEASRIYLVPNFLTAGNLFFGFLAAIRCIQANIPGAEVDAAGLYKEAVIFLIIAVICDGLDGRVARLGGKESLFGAEFDSLADVVSFGVVPALMVFFLILSPTETFPFFRQIGWMMGFLYLLCAAVRLARFNVLTHPMLPPAQKLARTHDFLGLPVPAAAGTIASIALVMVEYDLQDWVRLLLPVFMALIAYLMVSNVHYPSFKHIDWNTRLRFQGFIGAILLMGILISFKEVGLIMLFMSYIFFGLVRHIRNRGILSPNRRSPGLDPVTDKYPNNRGTTWE
jgi:CDP-diacylglycerol--serine O-phosphatidyltransferase